MAVHQTRLLNISETGLALLIDASAAPHVNEHLRVELPVPGGEQIAWWAVVVRTEIQSPNWWSPKAQGAEEKVVVALRFDELPKGHRTTIRRGLEARFLEDLRERRQRQLLYLQHLWIRYTWQILFYVACAVGTFAMIYFLSRPSANYDAEHGAPWGERFHFFDSGEKK